MAQAVKKKKVRRKMSQKFARLLMILLLLFALLLSLFIRVAYIKYVHGDEYEKAAEAQQMVSTDYVIPALRGSILDSSGTVLAESVRAYNVIVDCKVLYEASEKDKASTVKALCDILNIEDPEKVSRYAGEEYKEYRYLRLPGGQGIRTADKEKIQTGLDEGSIVGIWFEETEERLHPNDSMAAHILGFNGTYGVEQYYDSYLTGTQGRKMVVAGENGSYINEYIEARNGNNLILTLNATVQYHMETIMQEAMEEYNALQGCAICMNPKTGAVYGWVNMPTFNLNNVEEVIGATDRYLELYSSEDEDFYTRIWNNFGLTSTYQPGSTFKPIFAAAALEENLLGTGTTFECKGQMAFYDTTIQCAHREAHGIVTLREILSHSCNIGMTKISELFDKKSYMAYQDAYGIGRKTGIDLVGEVSAQGLIYTADILGPVEKATTSFGQGFNVTPIQLITAFSSVINGGEVLQPYVVSQITDSAGSVLESHGKTVLRRVLSEETSKTIRSYLLDTVETGTGGSAQVEGYRIGGKTGTAQQGNYEDKEYVVSFIGFTPAEDPDVILLVVLDRTDKSSSANASKTASKIFRKILPVLGIYPEP